MTTPKRVLLFSTDGQSGVVLEVLRRGLLSEFDIAVATEGASIKIWEEARVPNIWTGSPTATSEEPISDDQARTLIDLSRPDIIVLGTSSPVKGELVVGKVANELGIPVVLLPDTWNAGSRLLGVRPELVLAFDPMQLEIEGMNFPDSKIVMVGNPLQDKILKMQNNSPGKIYDFFRERGRRGKKTLLLVGQGVYTTDVIDWIYSSISMSEDWHVIPRVLHPNPGKQPPALAAHWKEVSQKFLPGVILDVPTGWKTDHLAAYSNMTVSVFSTVLQIAAYYGHESVSVYTVKTRAGMEEDTRLNYYPLVGHGAIAAEKAMNLDDIPWQREEQALYFEGTRWRPETALAAIKEL